MSPAYAKLKKVPKIESETDATKLLGSIIPYAFYLRVDRGAPAGSSSGPKLLTVNPMQMFGADEYYAWFYEGSQLMTYIGGVGMLAVMLAGVMFPLWPPIMRLGVWYISIGVLGLIGLFFLIAVVRLIFYIITVIVASPGIWIFPKLFADVGFVRIISHHPLLLLVTDKFSVQVESFIPLWEWDQPKKKKGKKLDEDFIVSPLTSWSSILLMLKHLYSPISSLFRSRMYRRLYKLFVKHRVGRFFSRF